MIVVLEKACHSHIVKDGEIEAVTVALCCIIWHGIRHTVVELQDPCSK